MTYATDQLKQNLNQVLQESENKYYETQARLQKLEQFMLKAEPYIKTLELIDPNPTE